MENRNFAVLGIIVTIIIGLVGIGVTIHYSPSPINEDPPGGTNSPVNPPTTTTAVSPSPTLSSIPSRFHGITLTDLHFRTTVLGSITATTDFNTYRVVLTQAGRLTLTITCDGTVGVKYVVINYFDSNGVQLKCTDNYYVPSGGSDDYIDLSAGTYYITIAKHDNRTGTYNLTANVSYF